MRGSASRIAPTAKSRSRRRRRTRSSTRSSTLPAATKLILFAPQEVTVGQSYDTLWQRVQLQGFLRVRIDGKIYRLEDVPQIDRRRKHAVEIVVDRIAVDPKARSRIAGSVETALDLGRGAIFVARVDDSTPEEEWIVDRYSLHFACHHCGRSFEELTPNSFSFNSPLGWCPACEGLGTEQGTESGRADCRRRSGTLTEGAIAAWPNPAKNPLFAAMLEAWAKQVKVPLDVPFERLSRPSSGSCCTARAIAGSRTAKRANGSSSTRVSSRRSKRRPAFRTVPATVARAGRRSPVFLVRRQPPAGRRRRVRFLDRTIHQLCVIAVERIAGTLEGNQSSRRPSARSPATC